MTLTLAALALVPLVGLARVDLATGGHRAFFASVDLFHGLIAVSVAVFGFYLFTFNVNLVAGRMFCGWGCPVGQLNRLTDAFVAQRTRRSRWMWGGALGGFAVLLSLSILLWWTSLGGLGALAALAVMVGAAVVFGRAWGWSFCRRVCPIGLYYSVVQTKRPLGILFDSSRCLDEGACVRACPVDLDARDLAAEKHGIGGFAIDGLKENSHCLRCGACVEACEIATSKMDAPALTFGRPERTVTVDLPAMAPAAVVHERVRATVVDPEPQIEPGRPRRWLPAAVMVSAGLAIASYAAVAARRASRYSPQKTWVQPTAGTERTTRYVAASGDYARGDIDGTAPAGAIVYLQHPAPGRALAAPAAVDIEIANQTFSAPVYLASVRDRLKLSNGDPMLHTAHLSSGRRSWINVPLPPGMKPMSVAAPAPGLYRITCDNHPGEEAELIVLDHPYVTRADASGSYQLHDVPAGAAQLVVNGERPVKVQVHARSPIR